MRQMRVFLGVGVLLIVIFGSCGLAQAAGNIHIGTLEINPFATIEQIYDDNIFLEPDNQENEDWITSTVLGIGLKLPLSPAREDDFILKAKYSADIISYGDETDQNRLDHTLSAKTDFNFANDLFLKISDDLRRTGVPPNTELTALEERLQNSIKLIGGYKGEEIRFDVGYRNIRDDYDNLNSLDKYTHIITVTAYYQLFPKTSIFGEYDYGTIEYDVTTTNSDSDYNQGRLGLKGELMSKLTGVVKVGFKSTDYDQASKDDFEGFTTLANLTYELQERSALDIYGERGSVESTYRTNSYYINNKIGLKLDHQIWEKLFLLSGGFYQLNQYPDQTTEGSLTAKRKDNIYDISIGLRYEMKEWMFIGAEYEYKQRDSKFSTFDYEDNRISAKVLLMM